MVASELTLKSPVYLNTRYIYSIYNRQKGKSGILKDCLENKATR